MKYIPKLREWHDSKESFDTYKRYVRKYFTLAPADLINYLEGHSEVCTSLLMNSYDKRYSPSTFIEEWTDNQYRVISQVAFARHVGVPLQRINEIVRGKRGVTPDTAWRFAQAFGTTPEFWMNLQSNYDLVRSRPVKIVERIHSIIG